MASTAPANLGRLRKETREWLATHTLEDIRGIAADLENAGEDVGELVDAINELEILVNEDGSRARSKPRAHA
ncbi:MAG: hypothetical protein A3K59_10215 [Euryarchaeota archaeon RBG_19FT_COMBO_69_17]|nr:MAG: hypothetical protein A3K59_10215 [Euryarchaeota archaeon RBG_19FT_COMBO_69_17]